MLSAAVSAGGPVYPGAHGAWHEARRLQEAQQRGTESLPQPARQRGRGQGAAAGGQQCITSAKRGRHPRSDPTPPIRTHGLIHTFYHTDTLSPQAHIRLKCHEEVLVSTAQKWALLPQQPFSLFKTGYCEDSLKTL